MVENDGRVRVLRVIARLNIGGPAKHVALLTKRLDPTVYDTTLVCGKISPEEGTWVTMQSKWGFNPSSSLDCAVTSAYWMMSWYCGGCTA
ncbi:MAG UNVERIFIED_CONTAM: hypothetical protein LVT10_23910 [Anaerolineae bacterium]